MNVNDLQLAHYAVFYNILSIFIKLAALFSALSLYFSRFSADLKIFFKKKQRIESKVSLFHVDRKHVETTLFNFL